jgi:hypothetical protein
MSAVQHRRRGTRPAKNKRPLTREAIDRAVAIYPCATDGASIAGLVPLRRRHPRNWAIILSAGLPLRSVPPEMSTGEFVHLGAKGLLLPRDERDGSLRVPSHRKCPAQAHLVPSSATSSTCVTSFKEVVRAASPWC